MTLALSGWRKLAPLRKQLEVVKGFLFLPILVEDEAVAVHISATLKEMWRAKAWVWREVAWPTERLDAAAPELFRSQWLRGFDAAIQNAQPNDTIGLNFSSTAHRDAAMELMPWINMRRESMRMANLRCLLYWPEDLKEVLTREAPDLWSMRAMNPYFYVEDVKIEIDPTVRIQSFESNASPHNDSTSTIRHDEAPQKHSGSAETPDVVIIGKGVALHAIFLRIENELKNGRAPLGLQLAQHALKRATRAARKNQPDALRDLAMANSMLGDALRDLGRSEAALEIYFDGLAIAQKLFKRVGAIASTLELLSILNDKRGDAFHDLRMQKQSYLAYLDGLKFAKDLSAKFGGTPAAKRNVSVSHQNLGDALLLLRRANDARLEYIEALRIREELRLIFGDIEPILRDLSTIQSKLGDALEALDRLEEARFAYFEALHFDEALRLLLGDTPRMMRDLLLTHVKLGDVLLKVKDLNAANSQYLEALKLAESLRLQLGDTPQSLRDVFVAYERTACVLSTQGRLSEALDLFSKIFSLLNAYRTTSGETTAVLRDLVTLKVLVGDTLAKMNRSDDACTEYAASLEYSALLCRKAGETPDILTNMLVAHDRRGEALSILGRYAEARAEFEHGLSVCKNLQKQLGETQQVLRDSAALHESLGDVMRHMIDTNAALHWIEALRLRQLVNFEYGESLASLLELSAPLERLAGEGDVEAVAKYAEIKQRLINVAPDHPQVAQWIAADHANQ